MRSSDNAPVASDEPVPPGGAHGRSPGQDDGPVASDGPGAPTAGQGRSPGRWRLWRPWLSLLAKPARRLVLLFILALVVEYLVVPELVGATKPLYLLGRVSPWWVVAGAVLEGV